MFHTAFVVADGTSVNDNLAPEQTALFAQSASASPDNTVECPWEVFRDLFIQDAPVEDARSVWERLVPQPFQPWAAKLDLAEFYRAGLPKSYIAVAEDRALPEGAVSGHVIPAGQVQDRRDGGQPRGDVHSPAELTRKLAEAAND